MLWEEIKVVDYARKKLNHSFTDRDNVRRLNEALTQKPDVRGVISMPICKHTMLEVDGVSYEIDELKIEVHAKSEQASSLSCTSFERTSTWGPSKSFGQFRAETDDHIFTVTIPKALDGRPPQRIALSVKSKASVMASLKKAREQKPRKPPKPRRRNRPR